MRNTSKLHGKLVNLKYRRGNDKRKLTREARKALKRQIPRKANPRRTGAVVEQYARRAADGPRKIMVPVSKQIRPFPGANQSATVPVNSQAFVVLPRRRSRYNNAEIRANIRAHRNWASTPAELARQRMLWGMQASQAMAAAGD